MTSPQLWSTSKEFCSVFRASICSRLSGAKQRPAIVHSKWRLGKSKLIVSCSSSKNQKEASKQSKHDRIRYCWLLSRLRFFSTTVFYSNCFLNSRNCCFSSLSSSCRVSISCSSLASLSFSALTSRVAASGFGALACAASSSLTSPPSR